MATRTISVAGGNYNTTAAWLEGAVPTSADDVVATAVSGNLTITAAAAARSVDLTGYVGTLTHNTSVTWSIGNASGGAFKFVAGMTYITADASSVITFVSTSNNGGAGWPITTAGKTAFGTMTFNGGGGQWVLQDSLTLTGGNSAILTLTSGTFDTNNQTIVTNGFSCSGSTARTLTLGSSTITVNNGTWAASTVTNLTVTANTATVNISYDSTFAFQSGTKDWNGMSLVLSHGYSPQGMTGAVTLANLTRTSGSSASGAQLTVASNITVTGTLTVTGTAAYRCLIMSSVLGTARTITVNGSVVSTYADWQDITAAGSASWNLSAATGGSGDVLGNTGITFTTSVNRYGKAAGNWSSTATWSATDGGAAGASIPLPQDDVYLTVNAGAGTYTIDVPRMGRNLDCTGFTRTLSQGSGGTAQVFGSLTLVSGMTLSTFGSGWSFRGRGSHTITSAGKIISVPTFEGKGGTYTFQDAFTSTTSGFGITHNQGTIDTNNQAVSLGQYSNGFGNTLARALTLGTSTVSLTGTGSVWDVVNSGNTTNLTLSAASSTITITNTTSTSRTFAGGGKTYGTLTANYTGTATLVITGSNTFDTINVSGNSARILQLTASTTQTVTTWNVNGTSGKQITLNSSTAGTRASLTKAGGGTVTSAYLTVKDIDANPGVTFYADPGGVDSGNNLDWTFGPAPVVHALAGIINGVSTAVGALDVSVAGGVAHALAGVAAGIASGAGTLDVVFGLTGLAAGISTDLGALAANYVLAGSSSGTSQMTGGLLGSIALLGVAHGQVTVAGTLDVVREPTQIEGRTDGSSVVTGSLSIVRPLTGLTAGISSMAVANLFVPVTLAGLAQGISTLQDAAITKLITLAGTVQRDELQPGGGWGTQILRMRR